MAIHEPKPWERVAPARRPEGAQERRRILIACEDSKSSCLYFKAFDVDRQRAEVLTVGTGMNTVSLVEETIRLKSTANERWRPYSDVWCVLDRDSFPLANYCRAFELAKANRISVAWANEAFELWYLLHFNYHDTGMDRADYKPKLDRYLRQPYDKADPSVFHRVLPNQPTAIRNARRLEKHWRELGRRFPERDNPSTNMHKLVELLNELSDRELGPAAPEG